MGHFAPRQCGVLPHEAHLIRPVKRSEVTILVKLTINTGPMGLNMDVLEDLFSRREMFYSLTTEHTDDFENVGDIKVVESEDVVEDAVDYMTTNLMGEMRYPGKSYAIAMLYAHWLEQLGAGPMLINLTRADLLNNDDPHFVPIDYMGSEVCETYTKIMERLSFFPDLHDTSRYGHCEYLMMTRKYFLEEFMLTKEQREILPFIPYEKMHFRLSEASEAKIKELTDFWLGDNDSKYWVAVDLETGLVMLSEQSNEQVYVVGPGLFHPVPR
jgi:hypothetical protein